MDCVRDWKVHHLLGVQYLAVRGASILDQRRRFTNNDALGQRADFYLNVSRNKLLRSYGEIGALIGFEVGAFCGERISSRIDGGENILASGIGCSISGNAGRFID